MTFLNSALAFGAIACSIPIVIHLLNRSRFRVVDWGAMHLLQEVIRVNRKRIRMEQLLLLLLRMSLIAILALCKAGPVLTGLHPLSGNAKTSMVMLFDNSYSMEAGGRNSSNYRRAQEQASAVIERLRRGSDLSVELLAGGSVTGTNHPTSNLASASQDLVNLKKGFGAADISPSLERAGNTVRDMQHAKRDIVIVSDFQARDWIGESVASRQQAFDLLTNLPVQPTITLFRVGSGSTNNVCVESVDVSPDFCVAGQQTEIRANLRNFGEASHSQLRVYLRIDGEDQDSTQVELGSNEDAQALFHHAFKTSGSHVIEIATDADELDSDNRVLKSVTIWDHIPVLMVDGDPSDEPLEGETDFLEIALGPFIHVEPTSDEAPKSVIATTVVEGGDLKTRNLQSSRVVVMGNVARLSDSVRTELESFVRMGGSLLIFSGSKLDIAWYNDSLFQDGEGLLPARIADLTVETEENATKIHRGQFNHPALALFNDVRNGDLSDAKITGWYTLDQSGIQSEVTDANESPVTVPAKLENDVPVLMEKSYGRGRVMFCTTTCDDDWSNLPARPFYLPFMQRLVTYLAASTERPRNVVLGQTLVTYSDKNEVGQHVTITAPDGESTKVEIRAHGEGGISEFHDTDRVGLYRVTSRLGDVTNFVVSGSREESDLTRLTNEELSELAESMNASIVSSAQEYFDLDSTRRYGREVWSFLFWIVIALLFGELLPEQLFSRVSGKTKPAAASAIPAGTRPEFSS